MKNQDSLECPVDFVPINEYKVRIVAFQVLTLSTSYLITGLWPFVALMFVDFLLRSFNLGKFSLLARVADVILKILRVGNKPVDQAPKRFAARIGLVFSLTILALYSFELNTPSLFVAGVLVLFSFLESVIGFCAGCFVYTLLKKSSGLFARI